MVTSFDLTLTLHVKGHDLVTKSVSSSCLHREILHMFLFFDKKSILKSVPMKQALHLRQIFSIHMWAVGLQENVE